MTDDQIRDLLRSPLDDDRPPVSSTVRRALWLGTAAVAVLVIYAMSGILGSSGEETAASAPGVTTGGVATTSIGDPGDGATTTTIREVVTPPDGILVEMATTNDGQVVMFGGFTPEGNTNRLARPDTWIYDIAREEWSVVAAGDSPSPRVGHAFSYHPPSGKIVLFGGGTIEQSFCRLVRFCPGPQDNQVWLFDVDAGTWTNVTPDEIPENEWPEERFGARFVFDPESEEMILFGGVGIFGGNNPLFYDDTWSFNVETVEWTRRQPEAPPAGRTFYAAAMLDGLMYMFGGDGPAGNDDATLWAYDPGEDTWTALEGDGPTARWFSLFGLEPTTGRLLLVGGEANVFNQISESVSVRAVEATGEVWSWTADEGWVIQQPLQDPALFPTGGTDAQSGWFLLHDGHGFLVYNPATDLWIEAGG